MSFDLNKEKFYIGISLGFNSSASIVGDKSGVLCAISQERLNRQKNTKQLPLDAVKACINTAEEKLGRPIVIEKICYSHYEDLSEAYLLKNIPESFRAQLEAYLDKAKSLNDDKTIQAEWAFGRLLNLYIRMQTDSKLIDDVLYREEHHTAHVYSCVPVYLNELNHRYDETLYSMTADGFGDGYSGRICQWDINCLKPTRVISQVRVIDSPALIYQFFTGALQFKEHQHEGKVTGLAAHCEAHPEKAMEVYHDLIKALTGYYEIDDAKAYYKTEVIGGKSYDYGTSGFWVNENLLLPLTDEQKEMVKTSTIVDFERFLRLKNTVYKFVQDRLGSHYNKDDILGQLRGEIPFAEDMKYTPWELAFAVQKFAENCILNWLNVIKDEIKFEKSRNHKINFMMAGGLVANVKLNQRIKDSNAFDKIFVSPPMGDEGTAIGCVTSYLVKNKKTDLDLWSKYGKGPNIVINGGTNINYGGYGIEHIVDMALKEENLQVIYFNDKSKLIDKVTDLLADNKIVHWCQGNEEFGPRALMNHSTLYTAEDPNGTHTLNQAMGRSEYMPYCPVCKNTSANELFENWEPGEASCRFMAMTMNCKPGVAEKYRGGVHVDNTARAQFVYEEDEFTKDAWDLLTSYEKKTGNKMMINTSFNIHNTPTCNLASDCWDAWIKSGRVGAALVIGNYIFINK